jgi:DNA repair exonuclease SbcCD ATPase subunit
MTRPVTELINTEPAKGRLNANGLDVLGIDSIKKELQKLSAANQELLKAFQESKPKDFGSSGNILLPPEADDLAKYQKESDRLKKENEQLRERIASLETKLRADAPTAVKELQEEFEHILNEKTETIRSLHMRLQEMQEAQEAPRGGHEGPSADQLDKRQADLERERLRLQQDEEALNTQAREMEMSLAKERAELARQRSELQRLHSEIQREMELAARDPGLRERLANLQRRSDGRPRSANALPNVNAGGAPAAARRPATMPAIAEAEGDATDAGQGKQGLFRRLFGG